MATVFQITSRPIIILSKCIGLINISYTMEPSGLLVHNINSTFSVLLEITRMIVLVVITYLYFQYFDGDVHIFQIINTTKFWFIIIAARLSTKWIIKFINGIIEFDRKITTLSRNMLIPQRSWTKRHWNTIFISLSLYFIGFKCIYLYLRHTKVDNILLALYHVLFLPPFFMDYVITITTCFFLQNIFVRFQTLNDVWKCLPADLDGVSNQWTHNKIVGVMENTRLLHSKLCELLKLFTLGYGSLLLSFFTSSFISMLTSIHIIVNVSGIYNKSLLDKLIPLMIHVQIVTFLMCIIISVSIINEKRLEIISYLRSYRISNLHLDKKRQINMFMNQVSACKSDQITAIGFFDINLNLVTTIIVLFFSGMITLIQMKNHSMISKFNNDTKIYFDKLFNSK